MATHKAIASTHKTTISTIHIPTPEVEPGTVLIQVHYASMVAFDTYITDLGLGVAEYPVVLGLNASGIVKAVGEGVTHLRVGDRATAFSIYSGGRKNASQGKGTMQDYILLPAYLCAKIPDALPLDAAATIADNFITSFYTLFDQLGLSFPFSAFMSETSAAAAENNTETPILVYGAGTTTGQYTLQLLRLAGYTNVVATASPAHHAVLLALGAKHVFDYRSPALTQDILSVALDGIRNRR
ncbi:PKS-ER domain-containing protein [Mycena kentingensis (nom. inval.)]|nr:PKS-ER domain-containing protein [Mycena kentingensis (nom. inval.)]